MLDTQPYYAADASATSTFGWTASTGSSSCATTHHRVALLQALEDLFQQFGMRRRFLPDLVRVRFEVPVDHRAPLQAWDTVQRRS